MTTVVVISDALIIRACNTPTGSGGVARFADRVARTVVVKARTGAPKGKVGDKGSHIIKTGGTYRASFVTIKGDRGNQHQVIRYAGNTAPHAGVIETGRSVAYGRQVFTWSKRGGRWQKFQITAGREGTHRIERAFAATLLQYGLL